MSKRAAAVAQTRQRIVDATRELHGEQGIAATSWDDIAARAGVGVGTVYRHFPSLDELIPACGEVTMEAIALPDPRRVPALFERVDAPAERIERLVREAFAIYERGAPELRAIRREPDVHPRVAQDRERARGVARARSSTRHSRRSHHADGPRARARADRPRHLAGAPRPGARARGGGRRGQRDARGPRADVARAWRVEP